MGSPQPSPSRLSRYTAMGHHEYVPHLHKYLSKTSSIIHTSPVYPFHVTLTSSSITLTSSNITLASLIIHLIRHPQLPLPTLPHHSHNYIFTSLINSSPPHTSTYSSPPHTSTYSSPPHTPTNTPPHLIHPPTQPTQTHTTPSQPPNPLPIPFTSTSPTSPSSPTTPTSPSSPTTPTIPSSPTTHTSPSSLTTANTPTTSTIIPHHLHPLHPSLIPHSPSTPTSQSTPASSNSYSSPSSPIFTHYTPLPHPSIVHSPIPSHLPQGTSRGGCLGLAPSPPPLAHPPTREVPPARASHSRRSPPEPSRPRPGPGLPPRPPICPRSQLEESR
ncbi:hypothetical protein Pcinc_020062 [Petrolisthes cinctipes]|uniref:Uncharacterized protein n=1 Tax=Petrolisthes cinctipes TaxID=88211 RepID=A0AAE1KGX9_PETCI|nr:hypothetical protein Pcinc_020062 [Petrolisthes cinctipes]